MQDEEEEGEGVCMAKKDEEKGHPEEDKETKEVIDEKALEPSGKDEPKRRLQRLKSKPALTGQEMKEEKDLSETSKDQAEKTETETAADPSKSAERAEETPPAETQETAKEKTEQKPGKKKHELMEPEKLQDQTVAEVPTKKKKVSNTQKTGGSDEVEKKEDGAEGEGEGAGDEGARKGPKRKGPALTFARRVAPKGSLQRKSGKRSGIALCRPSSRSLPTTVPTRTF